MYRGAKSKSRESARRCYPYPGRPQAQCLRPRSSKEVGAEYGHVDFAYLQGHKHTFLSYDLEEGDFTDMTWYEQELGTNTWLEKERE